MGEPLRMTCLGCDNVFEVIIYGPISSFSLICHRCGREHSIHQAHEQEKSETRSEASALLQEPMDLSAVLTERDDQWLEELQRRARALRASGDPKAGADVLQAALRALESLRGKTS